MGYFDLGVDDPIFPTTHKGLREAGLILESADTGEPIYNDRANIVYESDIKSAAISAMLDWNEVGDFSYDAMDACIFDALDLDSEESFSPDDEEIYNDTWQEVYNALCSYGVDEKDAEVFCNGPSETADNAAKRIGSQLNDILADVVDSNEDLLGSYIYEDAVGQNVLESISKHAPNPENLSEDAIFEATIKNVKMVRNGKKVVLKKALNKPAGTKFVNGKLEKRTAAEKAAFKKVQRKAHTAIAKRHRAKSFKKGQQLGLHK